MTRRSLRIALGVLWLLDGLLQLQPFMFTKGFAQQVIAPAASGQPFFVAGPVNWGAHLIGTHAVAADALFAGVQLALGVGLLLTRRSGAVRVALAASVLWAAGVWYLGEGLGGAAGGHATALVGAPGAALLYLVLALAAWPVPQPVGVPASRRSGTRPASWVLGAWAVLWSVSALLTTLPANIGAGAVTQQLRANAGSSPAWLAHLDRALGATVHRAGTASVVLLALVELAVGLLVLRPGAGRTTALWVGMGLAGAFWVVGQSFGQLLSGQATDPNTGPLVVLLGLTALACRLPLHRPLAPPTAGAPIGAGVRQRAA